MNFNSQIMFQNSVRLTLYPKMVVYQTNYILVIEAVKKGKVKEGQATLLQM